MPTNLGCIVVGLRFNLVRVESSQINNTYRPTARVASGVAEGPQLLQMIHTDAGFFAELTNRSCFERLIDVHKSSRNSPRAGKWFMLSPNEQHARNSLS